MFKKILITSVLTLILSAGIAYWQVKDEANKKFAQSGELPAEVKTSMAISPEFTLTDHHGQSVTEKSYADSYKLMLFGYSFCPDFCPTELNIIANALTYLDDAQKEKLEILFISIDPQRDTPKQLKEYTSLFSQKVTGLTGTAEQIASIKENFKIYAAEVPGSNKNGDDYLIDHSTFVYFMSPDNQLISLIRHGTSPEALANILTSTIQ